MGSIVYLIRPSEESIARSLCLKEGTGVVVALDTMLPEAPVHSNMERLSYEQMVEVLLKAEKVIAL